MSLIEQSNEALASVDIPRYNTRHTGFALNQSKLVKNLKKNTLIENYEQPR